MSDTLQGPGWWRASDGKWYPPEVHPNYSPSTPPPPPPVAHTAPPKTSGMAIASLVLSLAWVFGLGSLLAIIFAVVARRNIRESRGAQTGNGLAIAGLVIDILGLLGTALFIVSIAAINHDVIPTNVSMGTKVTVRDSGDGIATVNVESLTMPITGNLAPDNGKEYAAAKVEVCAGDGGSQSGVSDSSFSLLFRSAERSGIPANGIAGHRKHQRNWAPMRAQPAT